MFILKAHTFLFPLLLATIGMAFDGGQLLAQSSLQEVSPDAFRTSVPAPADGPWGRPGIPSDTSKTASPRADSLPYRIPATAVLRLDHDSSMSSHEVPAPTPVLSGASSRTDLLGAEFSRTGSISRGFLVGSNRDATVVSGFRLQFAGPLTQTIRVNAALTDENSPIQPEGTTQTLREVDNVSIRLDGPSFGLTLGDFFFERSGVRTGEFGHVSKKVQGVQGSVSGDIPWANRVSSSIRVVGASSRAQFHSLLIRGIEGVQGPYRLTGKNNEQYIVVVAGSERVSINGERLVRGETQDFVIDYATGEITFTPRRMITADSRVYVDFEYADRDYARNIIGADVEAGIASDAVMIGFSMLQEGDDPDNPIGGPLDAATESLLRSSGNDRWKASTTGIVYVGSDSVSGKGRGQYALRDTLVGGTLTSALVYAPGDLDALFTATFTRVEIVPSDSAGYRRVQGGQYVFAGLGQGTHVPRVFVEAPALQRTVGGHVSAKLGGGLSVSAEGTRSMLDRNRLSRIDDGGNDGDAYALRMLFEPGDLRLFGSSIGRLRAEIDQRFVDERFHAFGRVDPVEYRREWDIERSGEATERRRQLAIEYTPWSSLTLRSFLGGLTRSDGTTSDRQRIGVQLHDSAVVDIQGSLERVARRQDREGIRSRWDRFASSTALNLGIGNPSVDIRMERREETADTVIGLTDISFRFFEVTPRLEIPAAKGWRISGYASVRSEDSSLASVMSPSYSARGGGVSSTYSGSRNATASIEFQTRRTTFERPFRDRGNRDTRTTLVRTQANARLFGNGLETRGLYEFSSQQSSRLERVFVRVATGTGQYAYTGDVNANGLADDGEFEPVRYDGDFVLFLVPGETLIPVNTVKASIRLRVRPKEMGFGGVFARISNETHLRVEERSTDPSTSAIAFLHLSKFLHPATTLAGQQLLTNDLHVGESDPDLSVRFRVTESRGMTQLVNAPLSAYGNERSVRLRGRLANDVTDQLHIFVKRDRSLGDLLPARNRDLLVTGGSNDLAYRPDRYWELGVVLGLQRSEDIRPAYKAIADINEQALRVVYGVPARGSVRVEFRREEVTLLASAPALPISYELTGGRPVGRSWFVDARSDIRLTDVIQVSATYAGRLEQGSRMVHTARAEVRAVF